MVALCGCARSDEPTGVSPAAITLVSGFTTESVATGLSEPTGFAMTPDGSRVYITEKAGRVRVVQNGTLLSAPFMDIRDEVHFVSDYGLDGIAVHPSFPTQPYIYIVYNYDAPGTTKDVDMPRTARVERVRVNPNDPNVIDTAAGARTVIVGANSYIASEAGGAEACKNGNNYVQDCIPTEWQSHGIGQLLFGADGKLFVGIGDGTTDSPGWKVRSQKLESMASKILRVDPMTGAGLADNPFYDGDPSTNRSKIYSYGLRNPFRFSQHPTSGALYIGDVGWDTWEEINTGAGKNFGWPCYEGGYASGSGTTPSTSTGNRQLATFFNDATTGPVCNALASAGSATPPLIAWGHVTNVGGAALAGPVYTGTAYPAAYQGALFFYDFSQGWIKYATLNAQGAVASINDFASGFITSSYSGIVDLKQGPDGNLYYIYAGGYAGNGTVPGELRRIKYTGAGNRAPIAQATASPASGPLPLQVSFNGSGSTDPDGDTLTYAWTFGDGGTSTQANPSYTYTTQGQYTARLTVRDPAGLTASKTVAIDAGANVPVVTISTPAAGTQWQIGSVISFSGSATDVEDGSLSASMTWRLDLHHNAHVHPGIATATGPSGSYTVQQHDDNTYLDLCASATDAAGHTTEVCRSLYPLTTAITIASVPSGLTVSYGSQTIVTPQTFNSVVGSLYQVSAADQSVYAFTSWSDGGARSHNVTVGTTATTYTATFTATAGVTKRYEAELATLAGTAQIYSDASKSGGQFVGNNQVGSSVTFTNVDGGTGGSATLNIRIMSDAGKQAHLYVNGTMIQQLVWGNGSYDTPRTFGPLTITLNAGTGNTIKLQQDSGDAVCADYDYIEVTPSAGCAATAGPAAPTGLAGTAGNNQAALSWTAVSGATSYTVKRSTTSGSGYTSLATGVTASSYTDTTAANGTTYYYVVSASNCFGPGANSAQVSVTPAAPSSGVTARYEAELATLAGTAQIYSDASKSGGKFVGNNQVGSSVTFTNVDGGSGGSATLNIRIMSDSGKQAHLYVNGTMIQQLVWGNGSYASPRTFGPLTITLNAGTGNTIRIAQDTGDVVCADYDYIEVTPPAACGATAGPAAPTGLSGTVDNARTVLSWTAASGATSYTVKRSTTSGGSYAVVASNVTTTSYTDTGLTNGTTYYYVVSASNCFGAGADSAQVRVTPVASALPTPIVQLAFNENTGTAIANTGSAGGSLTRTTPTPAWSTNVPPTVGGASSVDFGTSTGNYGVDSASAVSALGGLTKFTITGWVNNRSSTEGAGGNRIVTWINNGGQGVDLVYKSDGSLQLGINEWPDASGSTPRSSAGKVTTSSGAAAGNWRFFAVTYDSTTSTVQYFFGTATVDATLDVTRTYSRGAVGTAIGPLTIGHFNKNTRSGATDRMFRGLVDNVRVHGAALTAAQVVQVQRQ